MNRIPFLSADEHPDERTTNRVCVHLAGSALEKLRLPHGQRVGFTAESPVFLNDLTDGEVVEEARKVVAAYEESYPTALVSTETVDVIAGRVTVFVDSAGTGEWLGTEDVHNVLTHMGNLVAALVRRLEERDERKAP